MKAMLLFVGGWLCIVLGVAGLMLPVVPGVFLLVTGVMLLSQRYAWARGLLARIYKRFPNARRINRD